MNRFLTVIAMFLISAAAYGQEYPQVEISNKWIRANLYLPDAEKGYYRATRFDWSGVIQSLRFSGHEYFGPRLPQHDPLVHNSISGPVESFGANLGYAEAEPGGSFVRIGIGILEKPAGPDLRPVPSGTYVTYKVLDAGGWRVSKGSDWIEFVQKVPNRTGYSYVYTKRIQLAPDAPEMIIFHTLENTGSKAIDGTQFNHNFLEIDRQPTGPGFAVRFPFEPRITSVEGDSQVLAARGNELVVLKAPQGEEMALATVQGYGTTAKHYDISVENRNSGAGVRITADRPLTSLRVYAIKVSLAPEPFIRLQIPPGNTEKWETRYSFYTLK
jgi:hypothetical protein